MKEKKMLIMKDDLYDILGIKSLDELDGELRDQLRALVAMSKGARQSVAAGTFVMKSQKRRVTKRASTS